MNARELGFWAGSALLGLPLSLAFAPSASAQVWAQVCTTDNDCASGTYCAFGVAADGGVAASTQTCGTNMDCATTQSATAQGQCAPLLKGMCESLADCDPGLDCVKAPTPEVACPVSSDGSVAPDCPVANGESRYGSCELAPMPCSTDTDCLSGLTCIQSSTGAGGGGSASGGTSTGVASGGATISVVDAGVATGSSVGALDSSSGNCGYQPKTCTTDADCGADFQCLEIAAGDACSEPACAPGEACSNVQPTCNTQTSKQCVPKLVPCASDGECGADSECFPLADLPLDVSSAISTAGVTSTCLPKGLALVLHAGVLGAGGALDNGEAPTVAASSDAGISDKAGGPGTENAASSTTAVTHGDGSVCAANPGQRGSNWLLGLLGMLGLALLRRRARS